MSRMERLLNACIDDPDERVLFSLRNETGEVTFTLGDLRSLVRLRAGVPAGWDERAESNAFTKWSRSEWPDLTPRHNQWLAWRARAQLVTTPPSPPGTDNG